ncbi:isopeptide-forming domain-containing fimbrial protein [Clostridium oceanicum]|uniref:DUF11 domain-containing protein n=1 Tax=Clostridium oceanicum TaxID=1543 RepID=A0ABP3UY56_9CLOT
MFDPSKFVMILNQNPDDLPLLLGGSKNLSVNIQNQNLEDRAYNLSLSLTLPDGIEFDSSEISPTSKIKNDNNETIVKWTNIKDLAPNELDFTFSFTVKSSLTFSDESEIPFDYVFPISLIEASIDTMPRGDFDVGNENYSSSINMIFKAVRFSININIPGEVLKGAGTSQSEQNWTHPYKTTAVIENNSREDSLVNIVLTLPDGIRYIGNVIATGPNSDELSTPFVNQITDGEGNLITRLTFNNVTLSNESENTVTFDTAIWNKLQNNTGEVINHGTSLQTRGSIEGEEEFIEEFSYSKALDIQVTKSSSKSETDVNENILFSFTYEIGEYYDLNDIEIIDSLPDGLEYISSSLIPDSVENDTENKITKIIYNIGNKEANTKETVTITTLVKDSYIYVADTPVVSGDVFVNQVSLAAFNFILGINIQGSASRALYIETPTVTKELLNIYYRDGTPKLIDRLAPNDLAEFSLFYDAEDIEAIQKDIFIDDFFPLSLDPIDNIEYNYSGYTPEGLTPELIDPHGVSFPMGDIPSNSTTQITFKVPVDNLGNSGADNNLLKLKGINTKSLSYSDRDQISLEIGEPNFSIFKDVSGNNINAIKAGETYTCVTIITNTNALGTETDAFDFSLIDEFDSEHLILNENSISITGNGSSSDPIITENSIEIPIESLYVGQGIVLNYQVTVKDNIAPDTVITKKAFNTAPYSQVFDPNEENFQYTDAIFENSVTMKSKNISISKTSESNNLIVGSQVEYDINVVIPEGTTAYNLKMEDILPDGQVYVQNTAKRNGLAIIPTLEDNKVIFPEEAIVDATSEEITIIYSFTATIQNADKAIGAISSVERNRAKVYFDDILDGGTTKTISKNLNITVFHPNMELDLTGKIKSSSDFFKSTIIAGSNEEIQVKLDFLNDSSVLLRNGAISIPLGDKYTLVSIDEKSLATVLYDPENDSLIAAVNTLNPSISGFVKFTLKTAENLPAGTTINIQATAIQYENNLSNTKVYSGETSAPFTVMMPPSLSFLPNILDRVDENTLFKVSPAGANVTLLDILTNTSKGIDSFSISIQPAELPYKLYIDNIKVADVEANEPFSSSLDELKDLSPYEEKDVSLNVDIPQDAEKGKLYNFIVTITSLTDSSVTKTILNIDPDL